MKIGLTLLAALALGGCLVAHRYTTVADVPPDERPLFAKLDEYYLGKAKEQASFTMNCSPEQISVRVVSTTEGPLAAVNAEGRNIGVERGDRAAMIGAEGCGQRTSFQVLCGPHQYYGGSSAIYGGRPCEVIPSSDASRVVTKNNEEQHRIDEEAAAAAAAQQPSQQPKSSNGALPVPQPLPASTPPSTGVVLPQMPHL